MKKSRKTAIIVLFFLSALLFAGGIAVFAYATEGAKLDESKLPAVNDGITVFDADGNEIESVDFVKIEDISPHIVHAFIAIEDKRFFKHNGIDLLRVGGAFIHDVKNKDFSQGGSTITCQLVKNTQLSNEKTLRRKAKEAKIALELEKKYTKEEILEMYLNILYFGKGVYGIKSACNLIFNKSPKEVSVAEAASLAATVANPSKYSPLLNKEENAGRKKIVLQLMREQGYLTKDTEAKAQTEEIIINKAENCNNTLKNVRNLLLLEAKTILKEKGRFDKNVKIYSYIIPSAQCAAESAIAQNLTQNTSYAAVNKRILLADNKTGGIIAYAGEGSPFTLPRQPGSTIKPLLYGAAIEKGKLTTQSQFLDEPTDFSGYSPKNYKEIYYGWVSAEQALGKSLNSVAVKIMQEVGIEQAYDYIERSGIKLTERDKTLSLALGGTTYGSTISELCTSYMTLANQGARKNVTFIAKIEDYNGKTIYQNKEKRALALSPSSAYIVTEMLKNAAKNGTAKQLSYLNFPIAAKTGTVAKGNGNSDAWVAGYTSKHTFVCWFGSTDGAMDSSVTGGNQPTKTARYMLESVYKDDSPKDFIRPSTVSYAAISTDIKERFHLLVPQSTFELGRSERIPISEAFSFDAINKSDFYLANLDVFLSKNEISVRFDQVKGVTYDVFINDQPCDKKEGAYRARKTKSFFEKVEIVCKNDDIVLYKKRKFVTPYGSRMVSTFASACAINAS